MRKNLEHNNEQRLRFSAVFARYGVKNGWMGLEKTLLFKNVVFQNGGRATDHIWFTLTKGFQKLGELQSGDKVEFDARIKEYVKGYFGHDWEKQLDNPPEIDYKLSHPTKITKIVCNKVQEMQNMEGLIG